MKNEDDKRREIPLYVPDAQQQTLWGFYKSHFAYISKTYGWEKDSTKVGHEYRMREIVSHITNHDTTAISEYGEQVVDNLMCKLKRKGQIRGREKKKLPYDAKTLAQFETLLIEVLNAAADHALCMPIIRKSERHAKTDESKLAAGVIRRHLWPEEEFKLLLELIPLLGKSGEARAVCLALVTGLRTSECCAINWAMLRCATDEEAAELLAAQTTKPGYSTTKLVMKTHNGHRVILICKTAYKLFMKVKEKLVAEWVAAGHPAEAFELTPVGCKGTHLEKRCCNHDLSDWANAFFVKTGIRKASEMEDLAEDLIDEYEEADACGTEVNIEEFNSPSFYLLRHWFATVNAILMLSVAARQYFQGHQVDDPAINRRIFTSSRVQAILAKQLEERALLNPIKQKVYSLEESQRIDVSGYSETIIVPAGDGVAAIHVFADEPGDGITIRVETEDKETMALPAQVWASSKDVPPQFSSEINILRFYHEAYQPYAEKLLEVFPELYD